MKKFLFVLISLALSYTSFAQAPTLAGSWSLNRLSLTELAPNSIETPVDTILIKYTADFLFDRLELASGGRCILTDGQAKREASYTLTDDTITISYNEQDYLYSYSLDGGTLTLTRAFENGNVSGEWASFRLSMAFSPLR